MKITIFGSNGRVGRLIVAEALKRGYGVKAFVHGTSDFEDNPLLEVVHGNVHDPESVASALAGSRVVISALGSWGTPGKDILTAAMTHIIPVMERSKMTRIITLTGADCHVSKDTSSMLHRLVHRALKTLAEKVLSDSEQHVELLQHSSLNWTVVRSPIINSRGTSGYKLSGRRSYPWSTVSRQSVAMAMLDLIESNDFDKSAPFIARR